MSSSIRVIANPAAGRGLGARLLPAARAAFAAVGVHDVRVTSARGDETRLAREALDDGVTTLAVLGGDGTWGNVASVLAAAGAESCALAALAAGTGSDFAKSAGIAAHDFPTTARLAAEGRTRAIDMGRIGDAHFLNVAGFGFDAAVTAQIERTGWLSGNAVYLYAALRELFGYRGFDVATRVGADGTWTPQHDALMLVFGNGRYFGGSFEIAPNALMDDGLLDVVEVGPARALDRLRIFTAATKGTHVSSPNVRVTRARSTWLRFEGPTFYEADGEIRRARDSELEVACVPNALRIVAA